MTKKIIKQTKPEKLYRYIKIDDHLDSILLENKLFFSNPANFNDPLELQAKFVFSGGKEEYSQFKNYMQKVSGNKNALPGFSEFIKLLNSPDFQRRYMGGFFQNAVSNWRITCLSEQRSHNIMFAHYSDKHTGLCLMFKIDKDDGLFREEHLIPVNYSKNLIEIDLLNYSQNEHKMGCLLSGSKQKEWSYEKEWRLIVKMNEDETDPKLVEFNPEFLTNIILGLKVSSENRKRIQQVIKKRKVKLDVFETYITYRSYQLGIKKIDL